MPIDPIDTARDEARSLERKRTDTKTDRERAALRQAGKDFKSQHEAKIRIREAQEKKLQQMGKENSEEGLLDRIMKTYQKKEESGGQDKKESQKKEESKKERANDASTSRAKTRTDDGHSRVESKQSSSQQGKDGEGEGRPGGGGSSKGQDGQSGGGSGGSGGSSSGFSGSNQERSPGRATVKNHGATGSFEKKIVSRQSQFGSGGQSNAGGSFSHQQLDRIVESVQLRVNDLGEKEIEITLGDDTLSGLKFKVSQSLKGLIICFMCPNSEIKKSLILNRLYLYNRLKEKNIHVYKIELE